MTALSKWRETPYRVNNVHAASDPANGAGYTDFAAQGILDPSITEAIRERQVIEWASALDRPVRDWIQAHVHGSKNINNSRYFTGIGCIVQLDTVDDYQYRHGLHVHMHFHAHRHSTLVSFLPVIQFMTYPWSAYNTTYREETSVWEVLPHHAYGHLLHSHRIGVKNVNIVTWSPMPMGARSAWNVMAPMTAPEIVSPGVITSWRRQLHRPSQSALRPKPLLSYLIGYLLSS